jgi:3-methyl-2-oxobutanoate hydroxymethyltransferase
MPYAAGERKRTTMPQLVAQKGGEPIVMVTAYDATMAKLVDEFVDAILIGDSLGMVVQGLETTIPVTLEEIIYHTRMVVRGARFSCIVADLPFNTYNTGPAEAVFSAGRLLKEGGAHAVKLEGGLAVAPQVKAISEAGVPVVAHIGVTPQAIHALGSYGKQGKTDAQAKYQLDSAKALAQAGASMIVLENVPHELARQITEAIPIPTIGIGAGPHCDGQVQIFHDLLGLFPDFTPRHAKRMFEGGEGIRDAIQRYATEVRERSFMSK